VFFDGLKGTQLNFDRLVGAFESIDQHGRLGKVFPGMNGEAFKSLMRFIQSRFEEILSALDEARRNNHWDEVWVSA
jgi:hypothetical protein